VLLEEPLDLGGGLVGAEVHVLAVAVERITIDAWPARAWTRFGLAMAWAQIVMQAWRASCSDTGTIPAARQASCALRVVE
jgi:hypothetical protein